MYHDTLIRIQNNLARKRSKVKAPYSKFDFNILEVLVKAGYLDSIQKRGRGIKRIIDIKLKYDEGGKPVISGIKFISRPSRGIYSDYRSIRKSHQGYGDYVLSTPKGVMSGDEAKRGK
ncbi:MAG: 30S ribosomal protein S8, partial [Candidatus Colwellbacteria bacterium RBG_13_48_8]